MLHVGYGSAYSSQLLWTSASDVDFSNPVQGRTDGTYSTTTPTLNVNFTMAAQYPNTQCYLFVPNLGSNVFIHDSNFFDCNTQWIDSFNWYFALADPTKGDQTYVYHIQLVADLPEPHLDRPSVDRLCGVPFALTIPDGGNVNFSGSMAAQTSNAAVRANLAVSQFAPLASGVSPTFSGLPVFTINVQPYTAEYYLNLGPVNSNTDNSTIAPLVLYPYGQTTTDSNLGDVSYANPFPTAWPTYAPRSTSSRNFLTLLMGPRIPQNSGEGSGL